MTIGDALFARLSVRGFARIGGEISDLQARIAAGTNDPRPSADPARAAELSGLRDQVARLDRYSAAAKAAEARLALTDVAMQDASEVARRWREISVQAGQAALPPEAAAALRAEVLGLRERLVQAANAQDGQGRPLFAGTSAGPAFALVDGHLRYAGNDAPPMFQIGDFRLAAAGISGASAFGDGPDSLFDGLSDLAEALGEPALSARDTASATGHARLDLDRTRAGDQVSVLVEGPLGTARIALDLRFDAPGAAVAAFNAVTASTGVTAALLPDGNRIELTATGPMSLSAVEGQDGTPRLRLTPTDPGGTATGQTVALRPKHLSIPALVADASAAADRLAGARATAGAMAAAVEQAQSFIADRRLVLDEAVSRIEVLDVAAAVTRLQSLLTTQSAAQQTYARIAGQTLFDFLR